MFYQVYNDKRQLLAPGKKYLGVSCPIKWLILIISLSTII